MGFSDHQPLPKSELSSLIPSFDHPQNPPRLNTPDTSTHRGEQARASHQGASPEDNCSLLWFRSLRLCLHVPNTLHPAQPDPSRHGPRRATGAPLPSRTQSPRRVITAEKSFMSFSVCRSPRHRKTQLDAESYGLTLLPLARRRPEAGGPVGHLPATGAMLLFLHLHTLLVVITFDEGRR